MSSYVLELKDVVKTFGGVTALNKVAFRLKKGEVHALMGENGAGKSTLIKTITGVHKPDSGEILYNGKTVEFHSSQDSAKIGIAAVYQHVTAFPTLSVTENIFMGQEIKNKLGFYDWKAMRKKAKELLAPLNDSIDVDIHMSALTVAEQQTVEIAKALSRNLQVLILDEPTASLTQHECEELYKTVDHLKEQGVSVIFISHRMEDMYRVASKVTVFRDAKYIGTWDVDSITEKELINYMVGRELDQMYPERHAEIGDIKLEARHLTKMGRFKDVSFYVKAGEVVAFTGLVGAGRTEVFQSIFGVEPADEGDILLEGKKVTIRSPKEAFKLGIGLLPEDRQLQGLVYELPIYQNVSAATQDKFTSFGMMDVQKEKDVSENLCGRIALKAESINATPNSLSGGNQQKVVFAKMLNCDLKVLILDEPTKGVDVGAKYSIYEIVNRLAEQGYAIVFISSEMPEVLGMADRIYTMYSGRITGEVFVADANQELLLKMALKKKGESEE